MIDTPYSIVAESFQDAWIQAIARLKVTGWECRNLVVQIRNPRIIDQALQCNVDGFFDDLGLLLPKHVAYTIFPHNLYHDRDSAKSLFEAYNGPHGFYSRLRVVSRGWGNYFRRMTHYESGSKYENQLGNIIGAINRRKSVSKAAYTIVVQKPGRETVRPLGGPCLNYVAVQLENTPPKTLSLLAVYRNHDFLKKAYGNYWGLCNLIQFLADETSFSAGPVTCISSHAYVDGHKVDLEKKFIFAR